jgi:hypothetical protein
LAGEQVHSPEVCDGMGHPHGGQPMSVRTATPVLALAITAFLRNPLPQVV